MNCCGSWGDPLSIEAEGKNEVGARLCGEQLEMLSAEEVLERRAWHRSLALKNGFRVCVSFNCPIVYHVAEMRMSRELNGLVQSHQHFPHVGAYHLREAATSTLMSLSRFL